MNIKVRISRRIYLSQDDGNRYGVCIFIVHLKIATHLVSLQQMSVEKFGCIQFGSFNFIKTLFIEVKPFTDDISGKFNLHLVKRI